MKTLAGQAFLLINHFFGAQKATAAPSNSLSTAVMAAKPQTLWAAAGTHLRFCQTAAQAFT